MTRTKPTPEELLQLVEAEERYQRRGKLKVFLGYASGVGKSLRMFDEGRRRKARGEDVIVAGVQAGNAEDVQRLLESFDVIPLRPDRALDMGAIRGRRPHLCLIDGLAFTNGGIERWRQVEELLASGISVLTTINLQFIRERQPQVEAIRAKRVTDSVPESFILGADEIEIVDASPEYCMARAQESPLLEQQLSQLREIALVLAAEVVDHQLESSLSRQARERILICITPRSNAGLMIHRGKRQADRFHAELHAVYVERGELSAQDRLTLDSNLKAARDAGAAVEILRDPDPIGAILRYAEKDGITQIFVGHSLRTSWRDHFRPNPVERLILEAEGIDVRVFPHGEPAS